MALWQSFLPASPAPSPEAEIFHAPMPDGSFLALPLRDFGDHAVAGLIANQASFAVLDQLTGWMAKRAACHAADIVVGLPTLGHAVAPGLARALGHPNWVAAGFSRKLWYDFDLSVPVASVTSPGAGRRLWLDPRLLPRLARRRVLLADDVISSGRSIQAGLSLLRLAGILPVAVSVVMIQGDAWRAEWDPALPLSGAFATPLFRRGPDGWQAQPGSAAHEHCVA